MRTLLTDQLKKECASSITISFRTHVYDAIEGGIGDMQDDQADRTVNRVEISCRAIGDPPESLTGGTARAVSRDRIPESG